MFGEILKKIKAWYEGDPGDMKWNPITDTWVGSRKPSKHWTARLLSYLVRFFTFLINSIKRHPNAFISQTLVIVALLVSFYFQFYGGNDKYKRCTITHSNDQEITLNCRK